MIGEIAGISETFAAFKISGTSIGLFTVNCAAAGTGALSSSTDLVRFFLTTRVFGRIGGAGMGSGCSFDGIEGFVPISVKVGLEEFDAGVFTGEGSKNSACVAIDQGDLTCADAAVCGNTEESA